MWIYIPAEFYHRRKNMRQEFSIVARHGKKGRIYYVRYFLNNKMIPSQWSTKTENYDEAKLFAITNRERIINQYFNRKEGKTLYSVLHNYYAKDSSYLAIDAARGRKICETSRKILHGFITNTFIPFLLENKIKTFSEIKPLVINRFQNYLLMEKGLLPQSINRQISGIKSIFSHLYMTGVIEQNIMRDIAPLRAITNQTRGCHPVDKLSGIFKTKWKDKKSYLLCSLIYSAGLRNSEIKNLKVKDILKKDSLCFLNIEESKTVNGIRMVPLHHKVEECLKEWIKENHLSDDDYLFVHSTNQRLYKAAKKANGLLGRLLNKKSEELESENITFYSGRHFYKTMLNSHDLGDIEELFMGHSVSKGVKERYNHKNKRGEKELLKEAGRTIEIIDKSLFS
jgi:integrase